MYNFLNVSKRVDINKKFNIFALILSWGVIARKFTFSPLLYKSRKIASSALCIRDLIYIRFSILGAHIFLLQKKKAKIKNKKFFSHSNFKV